MANSVIEENGWLQGSIVDECNIKFLMSVCPKRDYDCLDGLVLVVASQSCDIANGNYEAEPFIEVCIAKQISSIDGNLSHNKNPRKLHTKYSEATQDINILSDVGIEINIHDKFSVPKQMFEKILPDGRRHMDKSDIESFANWIAARYSRPALPTSFNDLINKSPKSKKLRQLIKKHGSDLTGIYIKIFPDRELLADENYSVQVLGLLPAGFSGNKTQADSVIQLYKEVLEEVGIETKAKVTTEDQFPLSLFREMKRFYLDDLSYKDSQPLPAEVVTG